MDVVDRRAEYYKRVAPYIAKDPLSFYTRAERGRRLLGYWHTLPAAAKPSIADTLRIASLTPAEAFAPCRG